MCLLKNAKNETRCTKTTKVVAIHNYNFKFLAKNAFKEVLRERAFRGKNKLD